MQRALFVSLVLAIAMSAFAGGGNSSKTTKTYGNYSASLFTQCFTDSCFTTDQDGVQWRNIPLATWTLPQGATVTRLEVTTSASTVLISSGAISTDPCPVASYITLTDGTNTYNINLANDGTALYTDSGTLNHAFAAGAKLQLQSHMAIDTTAWRCNVPESGNVTLTYSMP